jgi:putative Holliday junction resolvase
MKRALGLDVGSKTIGVAVTDELGIAAHPVLVHQRVGTQGDVERMLELVAEYDVGVVVVGLPLELSGKVGHRAKRVRVFSDALENELPAGVSLDEFDERFSTSAVERVLLDADVSRKNRKAVVDKQAAAFILQGWLSMKR